MQKTRKFTHLGSEAKRLAAAGVSRMEIARQLGVNYSTVHRWMASGRLGDRRGSGPVMVPDVRTAPATATDWASQIRAGFVIDCTDEEIIRLGELALSVAHNPTEPTTTRLSASARFLSLSQRLTAHARPIVADAEPAPAPRDATGSAVVAADHSVIH